MNDFVSSGNNSLSKIIDNVVDAMQKENCRVYDTDILRAINRSTYYVNSYGDIVISVDCSDLVKHGK